MIKSGVYFIVIALFVAELFKILASDVTMWTQSGVKSQKLEYISRLFLYRTETYYSRYSHHKVPWYVHSETSMATQWAPGSSFKGFLLQEVLLALVVHSAGVSEYEHYTTEAQESLLDSRAKIRQLSF